MKKTKTEIAVLAAILLFSFLNLFYSLGDAGLWQDEAQTALIGKSVLETGLPRADDGKNKFHQVANDNFNDDRLWHWHPWLQFYISAASQKIFGSGTFGARALFTLFGFLCIPLVYLLSKETFNSRKTALLSALFLAVSISFILMSRQSRYYAPLTFLFTCSAYGYMRIYNGKKFGALITGLSTLFLFHAIYAFILPLASAAIIHAYLFNRKSLLKTILAFTVPLLINSPFLVFLYTVNYNSGTDLITFIKKIPGRCLFYTGNFFTHIFGPVSIAGTVVLAVMYLRRKHTIIRNADIKGPLFLLFVAAATAAALILLQSQKFLRYFFPLLPVFAALNARIAVLLYKKQKAAGIVFAVMLIVFSGLCRHIREISKPYNGPLETISAYLNSHAGKDDIVYMGGYGDLSLKYYTGLRITGGECRDSLSSLNNADWVIIRKNVNYWPDRKVKNHALDSLNFSHYEKITLNAADTLFENREDPSKRHYGRPSEKEKVVIYRKRTAPHPAN